MQFFKYNTESISSSGDDYYGQVNAMNDIFGTNGIIGPSFHGLTFTVTEVGGLIVGYENSLETISFTKENFSGGTDGNGNVFWRQINTIGSEKNIGYSTFIFGDISVGESAVKWFCLTNKHFTTSGDQGQFVCCYIPEFGTFATFIRSSLSHHIPTDTVTVTTNGIAPATFAPIIGVCRGYSDESEGGGLIAIPYIPNGIGTSNAPQGLYLCHGDSIIMNNTNGCFSMNGSPMVIMNVDAAISRGYGYLLAEDKLGVS